MSAKPMLTASRSSDLQFCPQPHVCRQQPHRWMKAKEVETDQHRPFGMDSKAQRLAFRLQDFMPPFCWHATAAERRGHCWVATYPYSSIGHLKSAMQSPARRTLTQLPRDADFCRVRRDSVLETQYRLFEKPCQAPSKLATPS